MHFREFVSFVFLAFAIYSPVQVLVQAHSTNSRYDHTFEPSSPFLAALKTLQEQINYKFESISLLRRAMTHPSYSEENNRALSVLGASLIETSVALRSLGKDIDISAKDLSRQISEISKVEASCFIDGMRLGLEKVVRVSPKTNSSTPAVVCGAFRAIFGAIAIDVGKSDDAGTVFWTVHGGDVGRALALYSDDSLAWTKYYFTASFEWCLMGCIPLCKTDGCYEKRGYPKFGFG